MTLTKHIWGVVFFCLTSSLHGQQQTISVPVIVIGGDSGSVTPKASDLKVETQEMNVAVVSLKPLASAQLQYVLLNDQSGRTQWLRGTKEQAEVAGQFLKQIIRPGSDIGSLVNFGDQVYIDVQNSEDPDKLSGKLQRKGVGATRMYDAVVSSANWLGNQTANVDRHKLMFLFCDGEDNGSTTTLAQATDVLQQKSIPVFIVAPPSVEDKKQGANLRKLANDSGGRAYFLPPETKHIRLDFIKHDLDQSFVLALNVPSSAHGRMPLSIIDVANPQVLVIAQTQIILP